MSNLDYWERFERTGNIKDYLNYIACTSEESMVQQANRIEEGGCLRDSIISNRNGFISHANWGL